MQPLPPRTRRIVLIVCGILFVVGAPILGLFSAGYRLDDALTLVSTGGMYVQSDLSNTRVFVNDEFVRQGGVLLRNTFVRNLRPNRTHIVRVERDLYTTWTKELYVQPNLVTEGRVFMMPLEREWRDIAPTSTVALASARATTTRGNDAAGTSDASDTEMLDAATTTEVTNPEHETLTELFVSYRDQFEFEVATTTLLVENGQLTATTTVITELRLPTWLDRLASTTGFLEADQIRERNGIVAWLEGGVVHTMWGSPTNLPPHFFCVIQCEERISLDWDEEILHYEFFPNRNDVLLVLTEKGLFAVELDNRGGRTIIPLYEDFEDTSGVAFRVRNGTAVVVRDGEYFYELLL